MTRKDIHIDAVIALAVFAASLGLLAVGEADQGGIDAPAVLLTALASLPLAWRRRWPLGVFVLTAVASTVLRGVADPVGPPLGATIALFGLAAGGDGSRGRTRLTLALVVALLGAHAAAAGLADDRFPGAELLFGVLLWSGTWLAGDRARLRAERMAELEERALRAEREAERERRLAAAEERMRIARDLHDSAGHAINVILVHAGAGRLQTESDPAAAREAFQTIEDVARETVGEIDQMVGALRDRGTPEQEVEAPPGVAALDGLVERHRAAGLDVTATVRGDRGQLPPGVERSAYRILQEALTNAARHGDGSARIDLAISPDALELTVANPVAPAAPAGKRRATDWSACANAPPCSAGAWTPRHATGTSRFAPGCPRRATGHDRVARESADRRRRRPDARRAARGALERRRDRGGGDASDGRDALYRTRLLDPDVVLMDVRMPDLDGISATRDLLAAFPDVRVVILTTFEQDDYIFGALAAGASGFLLKRTAPEELVAAIHTIAAGDSLLSPSVTSRVIERMAQQPGPDAARDARLEELTPREREVLQLVARGLSNGEIAATLVIEESTVKTHMQRLLAKLGARDRVQAVIFAYESGLAGA